jgi:hypothetical protein
MYRDSASVLNTQIHKERSTSSTSQKKGPVWLMSVSLVFYMLDRKYR